MSCRICMQNPEAGEVKLNCLSTSHYTRKRMYCEYYLNALFVKLWMIQNGKSEKETIVTSLPNMKEHGIRICRSCSCVSRYGKLNITMSFSCSEWHLKIQVRTVGRLHYWKELLIAERIVFSRNFFLIRRHVDNIINFFQEQKNAFSSSKVRMNL